MWMAAWGGGAACNTVVCSIAESAANLYRVLPKHNPNSFLAKMGSSFCVEVLYVLMNTGLEMVDLCIPLFT